MNFSIIRRAALPRLALLALLLAGPLAHGQQAPDAGRMLQELEPAPAPPPASQGLELELPAVDTVEPGGPAVTLNAIDIEGNTAFTDAELREALGEFAGQSYDLAGLYALAERISSHYRQAGYPFARAYLPAQRVGGDRVRIEVVEGRYGAVGAVSEDPALAELVQSYLAPLRPGALIVNGPLERATLLLDDVPGIRVTPVVRPGAESGTGDLLVEVERDRRLRGGVTLDNHGNRYNGEFRLGARLAIAPSFRPGDQVMISGLISNEDLRVGQIDYSLPLGASGLRGRAGYAYTHYELGKDFAALGATGHARIGTVGLSYPLLRSQRANVNASVLYQHKDMRDEYRALDARDDKESHTLPLTLRFDLRDGLAGGGLTFGAVSWTHGSLDLGPSLRAIDRATTQTHGAFNKINLDLARLQRLPGAFSLYALISAQWATDNLDSSESFGLGGAQRVRGYPSGEAFGDEGWLGQIELRYALGAASPYVFYDYGDVQINARPGPGVEDRSEHRGGAGLGIRWQQAGWHLDAALAWRLTGGEPESDTRDRRPQAWVGVGYDF